MPPPTSRDPSTAAVTRGRSGCLNCRRRRKKCDEKKPSCLRCQKHDDDCQWQPDFAFRLGVGLDAQHPSMVQSSSRKRSSHADLKIVDITFGPEGPKRTRRRLEIEEVQSDDDDVAMEVQSHSEHSHDAAPDTALVRQKSPFQSAPTEDQPTRPFPSVEQQPPIAADDTEPQIQVTRPVDEPNQAFTEFEAPVIQSSPIPTSHENQQWNGGMAGQDTSVLNAVLTNRALPPASTTLAEGDSPMSRESLNLEVLDYLASNPCNLELLIDEWGRTAMGADNANGAIQGFPPPESTAGSSPELFLAYHYNAADKELQSQLHDHMLKTARNMALTRQGTPSRAGAGGDVFSPKASSPSGGRKRLMNFHITEERYIELWQNYLDEVAPWLDMFDNQNHWRTTVARMAQRVECLQFSLLALSACQQERKNSGRPQAESINLYQEAIRLIIVQLPSFCTEIIAACVMLSVLEMMCSSSRSWAKHLDGCAILLEAAGVNGDSGGVGEALFWTFARMDVYRAFIGDTITTTPTNRWFISADSMSAAVRLFKGKSGSDSYANYGVFLCAGVVNILSNKRSSWALSDHTDSATFTSRWKAMYDLLEGWYIDRPEEMRPLMCAPASKKRTDTPFSTILYSTPPAISGNQMYHASMILLLQEKPKEIVLSKSHKSMLWHARQIWGISLSNSDHGALINGLQPMWLAGKLMSHHSEHEAILGALKHLEQETGWATSWRAKDLEEFWGVDDEEEA